MFREGALRDRIIQEGGQENEHDAGIEESAAALDIQGDPQAKQQILQVLESSVIQLLYFNTEIHNTLKKDFIF